MNQEVFVELIKYLWAITGRKDPPGDVLILGWYIAMRDITEAQLVHGIDRYVRERSSDYPTPQLLRELSGAVLNHDAAAMLAWDSVIDAIRIWGSYQVPRFDDHVTSHVIRHLGGWVEICGTEPAQLRQWTRQAFVKAYKSLAGVVKGQADLKCLIHDAPRPMVAQIEHHAEKVRKLIEVQAVTVPLELTANDREYLEAVIERRAVGHAG